MEYSWFEVSSFSLRLIVIPRLKSLVSPTLYLYSGKGTHR